MDPADGWKLGIIIELTYPGCVMNLCCIGIESADALGIWNVGA